MTKIGIGVCTTPQRRDSIKEYLSYCEYEDVLLVVSNDKKYNGAPSSRNDCIKTMMSKGCDYMFLFDDDCYPIMKGFDKYCVEQSLKYDVHFAVLPDSFKDKLIIFNGELTTWSGCIGSFSFFTRKHIETIGYYNTVYEKYGFTDPPYTYRSKKSPLSKDTVNHTSFLRLPFYIKSEDVYGMNPTPNYTPEEKQKFIDANRKIYFQEVKDADNGILFYPYTSKNDV